MIRDMDEWFKHWFEWFRPWKHVDVCHKRLVWTRWIGIPLHTWNQSFFELMSSKVGRFVRLDTATKV